MKNNVLGMVSRMTDEYKDFSVAKNFSWPVWVFILTAISFVFTAYLNSYLNVYDSVTRLEVKLEALTHEVRSKMADRYTASQAKNDRDNYNRRLNSLDKRIDRLENRGD